MTCVPVRGPGRRHGVVCTDDGPLVVPYPDCPNAAQHEPWPTGYVAASAYADRMMKTHLQSTCPDCDHRVIWTAKTSGGVNR